ncbi:excisionase family DNA-binding protein [Mycolicibacterium hodleri]|uniref:Helix-turn-helix domain-containing protein n=1 Tax=Mycolicibacterium hodleri TaxID=49897 RepID=A0A502E1J4_9MYCO|nr:excisionase family DNA-binding protein [Mycolicibacterium hodleri]TPG31658.1 helix-turn-helix domain-containing protein [Mycolicibacterium hodleri]
MKDAKPPALAGTYLSIGETAAYLGITTRTVSQMIADGRLVAYRCGPRVIRLRRDEIDAAMVPVPAGGA